MGRKKIVGTPEHAETLRLRAVQKASAYIGQTVGDSVLMSVTDNYRLRHDAGVLCEIVPEVTLRCNHCGKIFTRVFDRQCMTNQGCQECAASRGAASNSAAHRSAEVNLAGRRFHDLTVIERVGDWIGSTYTMWRVRCERCGSTYVIDQSHLGKTKACMCARRQRLAEGQNLNSELSVAGTAVHALNPGRTLNKNNKSGHRGVCLNKYGKWRAYINFRRKMYDLGAYADIDDAIKARAKAESEIYGDFLSWYAQEHPDAWERYKKNHPEIAKAPEE